MTLINTLDNTLYTDAHAHAYGYSHTHTVASTHAHYTHSRHCAPELHKWHAYKKYMHHLIQHRVQDWEAKMDVLKFE